MTNERTETHACDCISRAAAIEAMNGFNACGYVEEPFERLEKALKEIPAAQPKRNPGRWVSVGCAVPSIANVPMIKCTVCGHLEPDVDAARTPYCSHCGAYMEGGEGE